VKRVRVPAEVTSDVITEPVEGGWCEPCALPSAAAVIIEVHTPKGRHLLLCVVCRECESGRSVPWV